MAKPNIYDLTSTIELMIYCVDEDGLPVTPTEARITIEKPDATTTTVSGASLLVGNGYLSYYYTPDTTGWYSYEAWAKDENSNEVTKAHMFAVTDGVV